jgi:hypothetical protein
MFCAPGHVFGSTAGIRSRFRCYRGCPVLLSCFALPDSFSAVPSASGPVFMFCAPELIFGGTEGVGSRFHVLRSRTHFRRYRGRSVPFSCFALPDTLSAVLRASGPVFMFCAPGLIFGGNEGVRCHFHVLCARTHFQRYRGRLVPFSCFELPDMFFEVPSASGPVFMFCTPGLIFGRTEAVGSRFHVLRAQTHFRRYKGRLVPFSYFAHPDSISAVSRALTLVFMFWLPDSFSVVPRASGPVFMFIAPGLVF